MGNEVSNEGNEVSLLKSNLCGVESSLGCNSESYKGMKTDSTDKNSNHSNSDISEKTTEQTIEIDDSKIPYTFEWTEGGHRVLLTGQFVSWNQFFEMEKNQNGVHQCVITLPKQIYQFKFVVDGTWRCSNKYQMIDDGSHNTNNVIDLSKIENKTIKENKPTNISSSNSGETIVHHKEKEGYGIIYPDKKEMNSDAPHVPLHYINPFKVNSNTNQNIIGRKKYLESYGYYNIDENNCYRQVLNTPHVNLNHLIACTNRTNGKYVKDGFALRFRQKVVTIIYYKPL